MKCSYSFDILMSYVLSSYLVAACPGNISSTAEGNNSSPCRAHCPGPQCHHVIRNCTVCDGLAPAADEPYSPHFWPVAVGLVAALIILSLVLWRCRAELSENDVFKPSQPPQFVSEVATDCVIMNSMTSTSSASESSPQKTTNL
ncbi:hypothetical protein PoB_001300900 [Plakobranchus ocellatus]|uniref:Uncharacterized protein n=1 Tax=Plakobranchus ocellatus TaxID=259542 RepID=A0AAV3YTW3_9GAST|nr:hypothetical protein PoB_001300900 [Plakobranchus ocellatus]